MMVMVVEDSSTSLRPVTFGVIASGGAGTFAIDEVLVAIV